VGKRFYLGRYDIEEDAAMAYNYAAHLLAPGYIDPNDVPEPPFHIKRYIYEKCKNHSLDAGVIVKRYIETAGEDGVSLLRAGQKNLL